jgi:hypothetical protein
MPGDELDSVVAGISVVSGISFVNYLSCHSPTRSLPTGLETGLKPI